MIDLNSKNTATHWYLVSGQPWKLKGCKHFLRLQVHCNQHSMLHMQKVEEFINKHLLCLVRKDPEFVFDADTTAGLDRLAPQLLEKLNIAKTKPQLASILQSYASYDARSEASQTFIVQSSPPPPPSEGYSSDGGSVAFMPIGGGRGDSFSALVPGG
jgi:hypothetical protein